MSNMDQKMHGSLGIWTAGCWCRWATIGLGKQRVFYRLWDHSIIEHGYHPSLNELTK
jgi:hypothetical protein